MDIHLARFTTRTDTDIPEEILNAICDQLEEYWSQAEIDFEEFLKEIEDEHELNDSDLTVGSEF
jgi:hypothetical protein